MTYNVFSGTLNPTQSINQPCVLSANAGCRSETCCTRLAENTGRKNCQNVAVWAQSHNFVDKSYKYTIRDCNNQTIGLPLKREIQVLDLGVCFHEKLSFKEHIHAKINKAYMMLGLIKRNFKYLTIHTFFQLYISMVRSHLDYCSSVWAPYRK